MGVLYEVVACAKSPHGNNSKHVDRLSCRHISSTFDCLSSNRDQTSKEWDTRDLIISVIEHDAAVTEWRRPPAPPVISRGRRRALRADAPTTGLTMELKKED
ncbi:hypothetical protein EVAR_64454_1 [Eumeta japonica]|uniref:Uncharacterized protein n=1 Tax=Eumeta variegata TaxID=151549 RepID=A0A4C1ZLG9_EUMVA|nr:hypothetical protein EVAR_64454_1 [Eumeta japonica]